MATALSVPEGVSETLIAQLSDIQNQIKVLIGNHKILSARLSHNPQDDLIPRQLKTVESFLCQFNEKQKPILAEIREEIRQLRAGEEVASVISETIDGDEEETKLEADAKSKTSFVDRMAQVREKKRRKRRGGRPPATGTSSKRTTPSPTWDESKDSFVLDEEDSIGAGSDRFRGHVEEVEKFSVNIADLKKCEEVPEPVQRTEIFSTNEDPLKFMRNLDLITSGDLRDLEEHYEKVKKERREFRNLTYIPEFTEQKKKLPSYNWLSAEASSPPLLRTRRHKCRQLLDQSAAAKASQAAGTVAGTATAASTAAAASERKTRSRRRKDSTSDSTASTPMPMDEDEGEGEEEEYDEEESRQ